MDGISDNCPLKIAKEADSTRSNKSTKFCKLWEKDPQFLEVEKRFGRPLEMNAICYK